MSSETGTEVDIKSLTAITNAIVEQLNHKFELLNYVNDQLDNWDIMIITLQDDDSFKEIIKYSAKNKSTDFRLKIDAKEFNESNNNDKQKMIHNLLFRGLDLLEEKNVKNLSVVRQIITESVKENIDDSIEYYRSVQVDF